MNRFLSFAAAVTLAGGALTACGGSSSKSSSNATTTAVVAANTITITAQNTTYDKTAITAVAGQAVTINVINKDSTNHNITIPDMSVNTNADVGKTGTVTITPKAGVYPYHCEYHPDAMKGTLTVS